MKADKTPLVLDVDGTFLRTDMLFECFWAGLGRAPADTLRTCAAHFGDRAVLKRELAEIAQLRTDLLPVNSDVADLARTARAEGREVVFASASDSALVQALARDHGLPETVIASADGQNMKGAAKAAALVETYGKGGFDYAGNEAADRPVWAEARGAVVVGAPAEAAALEAAGKPVTRLAGTWQLGDLIRALRPHQWVKNVLLLVPMLASHYFDWSTLFTVLLGMVAFSFAASSIYIVNDLLDLEADRLHATKHKRPFASGTVPISVGMAAWAVLTALAVSLSLLISPAFLGVVCLYMVLSLSYSLKLKRLRWVDIATLAGLYTLRVVAGALAVDVYVSGYLLVFIFPTFVTLGCVKRLTEVTLATGDERLPGRGYGRPDRGDLLNVAWLGTFGALLVFFLYSFTEQARELYPTRWLLWVALVPLFLWLWRMVRLGYQGKQDYDPIVFAATDKHGLGLIFLMLAIMFYAAGLWQTWFG
ncbi:UbiA family prenyltransferase [Psychromarinibacter sp. C21-152]|uniref:UbiA family prenyltransferase n=1 Tax=Psychromarinibacter sediminicola TaxID=3033385 RepID=A0AAE3NSK7_9RHOB|nr:UbiA family prenyltransferase [Psychromarinibacter sediminicola]MDF0599792.1 UbiA family prenyltransferase [Psychromarinibacter sediminicola]